MLSVGHFQMVKYDKKASSNSVPLEEKVSGKVLASMWHEMASTPHRSPPGGAVHVRPLCLVGLAPFSWRAVLPTKSNQSDARALALAAKPRSEILDGPHCKAAVCGWRGTG